MNASYVCSDPKGTVIEEVGRAMVRGGYKIKVLNTIDFSCSMHYNPFVYLHSETDILTLVTVIMANTQGDAKGGDDFWQKAEALLYQALIAYIYYEAPAEEKNMNTLLDMLNACECREDDENFKSAVDLLFEQLENRNPDHFAVRQYKKFKMAAGVAYRPRCHRARCCHASGQRPRRSLGQPPVPKDGMSVVMAARLLSLGFSAARGLC